MACDTEDEVIIDGIWRGNTVTLRGRYKNSEGVYEIFTGRRFVFTATWRDGGLLRLSTDNGAIVIENADTWRLILHPDQTRLFPAGLQSVRFEVEMQYVNSDNQYVELTRWRGWFNVEGGINDEGLEPDPGAYTNTHWRFPVYFSVQGIPISLSGKTFIGRVYDSNLNVVMEFGGAGPGTIDMGQAATGFVILDATPAQHAAVGSGNYTWQLVDVTVNPLDPVFWASGTLNVSEPGGARTDFKVTASKDGSQASVWIPPPGPSSITDYLVEDPTGVPSWDVGFIVPDP